MHLAAGNRVSQNWISQLSRPGNKSLSWFINSEVLAPCLKSSCLEGKEEAFGILMFFREGFFGGVFFLLTWG